MKDLSNLGIIAPHKTKYMNRYDIGWLISEVREGTPLEYVAFWKADVGQENNMLSQWYKGKPIEANGRKYATAEQYMMSEKALLFGDVDSYRKIMAQEDPAECKRLGRAASGFNQVIWDSALREILFHGNLAKLQSDIQIVDALLSTRNAVLIEASPYDDVYGAGMDKKSLLAPDGSLLVPPWEWHKKGSVKQAQNHLGFVLMGIRDLFWQLMGFRYTPGMEREVDIGMSLKNLT